ncbi:hypothetical protein AGMMS49525_04890 [Bacteroidia bacterium]|nr:hypothetical protein AGMMS49525_04890 [Bacteroidia bacterium]
MSLEKTLDPIGAVFDKNERTEIQEKQKQEFKQIGSIRHRSGWTLYEINKKTLEIKEAKMEQPPLVLNDAKIPPRKCIVNEDCFYLEAPNKNRALFHYLRDVLKVPKAQHQEFVKWVKQKIN